jgi:hypothetical protein
VNRTFLYKDEDGHVKDIDLDKSIEVPKFTGNKSMDKIVISDYKSDITARKKDVLKLLEYGVINMDRAEEMFAELDAAYKWANEISKKLSDSKTGGRKPTLKKYSGVVPEIKLPSGNYKVSTRLPSLSTSTTIKPPKIKPLDEAILEDLSTIDNSRFSNIDSMIASNYKVSPIRGL